jgi:hypothetical protein
MIDTTTYDKSRLTIGNGYDRRPKGLQPSSLIIHTTSGHVGTAFRAEAEYIYSSPAISAHYLVGKQGQIVRFLESRIYRAWHAGASLAGFNNARSIGIECHLTNGESWTEAQRNALSALVVDLMHQFAIDSKMVETHRRIALPGPNIRKHDPAEWSDTDFYRWRDTLLDNRPLWRVKPNVTSAVVRVLPTQISAQVGSMHPSDPAFRGEVVSGSTVTLPGFGSSSDWVRMGAGFIWKLLLTQA